MRRCGSGSFRRAGSRSGGASYCCGMMGGMVREGGMLSE